MTLRDLKDVLRVKGGTSVAVFALKNHYYEDLFIPLDFGFYKNRITNESK